MNAVQIYAHWTRQIYKVQDLLSGAIDQEHHLVARRLQAQLARLRKMRSAGAHPGAPL